MALSPYDDDPVVQQKRQAVIDAALDYFASTNTDSFAAIIPHTTPPVYIIAGVEQEIILKLRQVAE